MSTYVTVGSVCWDVVEGDEKPRLGGSAVFASRVALGLGWDAVVITTGTPELAAAVRRELPAVEIVLQPSARDTAFGFDKRSDLGPDRLLAQADPVDLATTDAAGVLERADVVHLAPVMGELRADSFTLARQAPFVGISPQGLLRTAAPDGTLQPGGRFDTPWTDQVDAIALSEPELKRVGDRETLRIAKTAVTRGAQGAIGYWGDEEIPVDGIDVGPVGPLATIGAGDVFAAVFFAALATGSTFADALHQANEIAAAHVAGLSGV